MLAPEMAVRNNESTLVMGYYNKIYNSIKAKKHNMTFRFTIIVLRWRSLVSLRSSRLGNRFEQEYFFFSDCCNNLRQFQVVERLMSLVCTFINFY